MRGIGAHVAEIHDALESGSMTPRCDAALARNFAVRCLRTLASSDDPRQRAAADLVARWTPDMHTMRPLLCHCDLNEEHIYLGATSDTDWGVAGVIDYSDLACTELEYELVKVHLRLAGREVMLTRAFLDGYAVRREARLRRERLWFYTVAHRFSDWVPTDSCSGPLARSLEVLWRGVPTCESKGPP